MRNAEFEIIYILYICHENLNSVGADSISASCKPFILGKVSVWDVFSVPICETIFGNNYSQRKHPCFHRIKPLKTGVFVYCETHCGVVREIRPYDLRQFTEQTNYALRITNYALSIRYCCDLAVSTDRNHAVRIFRICLENVVVDSYPCSGVDITLAADP